MRRLCRLRLQEWLTNTSAAGRCAVPVSLRFLSDGTLPTDSGPDLVSSSAKEPRGPTRWDTKYSPRQMKRYEKLLFGTQRGKPRARRTAPTTSAAREPLPAAPDSPAACTVDSNTSRSSQPTDEPTTNQPTDEQQTHPPTNTPADLPVDLPKELKKGGRQLRIANLSNKTTWQDLKDVMKKAGDVEVVEVFSQNRRGTGKVVFKTEEAAAHALKTLQHTVLDGRKILLSQAQVPSAPSAALVGGDPPSQRDRQRSQREERAEGQMDHQPNPVQADGRHGELLSPPEQQHPQQGPPDVESHAEEASPAVPTLSLEAPFPHLSPIPTAGAVGGAAAAAVVHAAVAPTATAVDSGKEVAPQPGSNVGHDPRGPSTTVEGTAAKSEPSSTSSPETPGNTPGPSVQALIFTMLHAAKVHIENYELVEADKQLELAASTGATENPAYLHLLSILRLKQRRITEAAAARDALLQQHPEMLDNPVILSNAAWLFVHQRQPGKAIELLEKAESFGRDAPKDTVYIRALLHSGQNQLDRAEEVLRRAVLPDGTLIPLQDTTDVKLGMLLTEVLVLRERAKEAEPLVAPLVAASAAINGPRHVVTLCAIEGQAAVARVMGRHAEAVDLLKPVVADLGRQLGPHDLTLSAVGLLAKSYLDLFLAHRVQCGPVTEAPLSKVALDTLEALRSHVEQWLTMAEQVDPQGHDYAQAKHHHEVVQLVCRLEGLKEGDGAPQAVASSMQTQT